jgi:uncharacterized protein (TIGR04141 family)
MFGLDVTQDMLRAVVGTPKKGKEKFATLVAGSDALTINVRVEFKDLAAKCQEMLTEYASTDYEEHFKFIDDIKAIPDPKKIKDLDETLVDAIKTKDIDRLHIAPPKVLDWENVESFAYLPDGAGVEFADLDVEDYLGTVKSLTTTTIETLKKEQSIGITFAGSAQPTEFWRMYDSLICEVTDGTSEFILTNGEWYEVRAALAKEVGRKMLAFPVSKLALGDGKANQSEGTFNKAAAAKIGCALLDMKNVKVSRQGSPIEPCDLLTKDREFVHVKKKTRSSTLSHLFSQGTIAADAFYFDEQFREAMRKKLSKKWAAIAASIPGNARPNPDDYTVVYAIICKTPKKTWPTSLPFFSQLNLTHAQERLTRLGYKVALQRINQLWFIRLMRSEFHAARRF